MIHILVIEDEKRVADLLKIGLEENGYQVMVAYDGEMGLRLFRTNAFELIISDIFFPSATVLNCARRYARRTNKFPF